MRRIILTISIALIISVGLAEKQNRNKKVAAVVQRGLELQIDSVADYQTFKGEADVKISDNRHKITALKAKTSSDHKEVNEKYDLNILALAQKNNALEMRINNATHTRTNMWLSFMREFNQDMDSLQRSIKEMGILRFEIGVSLPYID